MKGLWRRGVVVITTAHLHFIEPKLMFCAGSNCACGVSEICDGQIPVNGANRKKDYVFRRSTIPQKQLIIM